MTDIAELKKAAEDCNVFCNKCGYIGKSEPNHIAGATGATTQCNYQAMRMMYVHNATVLKLIAVVEAARQWVGTAGPLYEAFKELDRD